MRVHIGLDVGSISVNSVVMDDEFRVLDERYTYCQGRPFARLREVMGRILAGGDTVASVACTGSGGMLAGELLGGNFVNEIVAQSAAVAELYPEAKTVIEMGGEDSKLILMEQHDGRSQLSDFVMNSVCAAGTGSFLDQQAKRIGVSIEREFGELALKSGDPPRIAGRCSVFAKSDMIHLQQIATPVEDIVAGLCFAVARNFKSTMGRGKELEKPVLFQGGVSLNVGMIRAFREILALAEDELLVPQYNTSMGAIGAIYHLHAQTGESVVAFSGIERLDDYLATREADGGSLDPLVPAQAKYHKEVVAPARDTEVALGIDVGSLSTNVVLIDSENRVVARRYLPTASRPLEAIRRGLAEIAEEVGDRVTVTAAGTTGSGRYLTGDFIGADAIQNEITAQATAAIAYDPSVDTIFEIGGQDSKYISIRNGVVVDFEMNKVCAAGTGSFLEEQAEKLGINIVEEFSDLAFDARRPAHLGDRCTVFMESDLNSHQQKGVEKENLVGGLAYSIVHNYIQKVVGDKPIGNHIFFQGGVTNNRAVVSAFEAITGKRITVPPHFDVTGAIGAAILARDAIAGHAAATETTRFKGFDVSKVPYALDKFTCHGCTNQCEIRRVRIEGETRPLFYGGRCERYEIDERKGKGEGIPNLFEERAELLHACGTARLPRPAHGDGAPVAAERVSIGIPRGLMIYYQQFPFWQTFFTELGFDVVVSKESDRQLVSRSLENLTAETCFPVEVMTGHVYDLFDRGVDYVFAPFVVNAASNKDNPTANYNCPWVQTYPFMIRGALRGDEREKRLLVPTLHFRFGDKLLGRDLARFMARTFGTSSRRVHEALSRAGCAQDEFQTRIERRGREVLSNLPEGKEALVLIGRPYNTGDPELNLSIVEKLINLDVVPIPQDFLPLKEASLFPQYEMMCWPNGQRILAAAKIVAADERLNAVYLGNFRCGPDSFISHYVREEFRGKPYLQLEVDEHSADAGMITRIEAFLDSLRGARAVRGDGESMNYALRARSANTVDARERTLYIPYMNDSAHALAAASRSCGVDAQVLPMQGEEDLDLGRRHTSSRECFPMICTTGSFLKKVFEPGFDPERASFFMPNHNGPCRFGQYNKLQDIIFRRTGFEDIKIVSPSNEDSYASFSNGRPTRFRLAVIRGMVAVDLLRKFQQEKRPYEAEPGQVDRVYGEALSAVIRSVEKGAGDIVRVMQTVAGQFDAIPLLDIPRKPVVAIVGEIFMRDNPFCSGFLVRRLEELGGETIIAPFREWITYSTYRWGRDSARKGRIGNAIKSRIQEFFQDAVTTRISDAVADSVELDRDVHLHQMLELCNPYVHKDYDGDPPLAFGAAAALARQGISGVVNILPFTCMPGTLIASVSPAFRADHGNIPWVNIAYDGQDDTGIQTRLQAFLHQTTEYSAVHELDRAGGPREMPNPLVCPRDESYDSQNAQAAAERVL